MTNTTFNRKKVILLSFIVLFLLAIFYSHNLGAKETMSNKNSIGKSHRMGDEPDSEIKKYEKKSLFIFPIIYDTSISPNFINKRRKVFLTKLMNQMFVKDFRRINFYDVNNADTIDSFLQDADSFIHNNAKTITALRLQPDGKFKEAMITVQEIIKTIGNSFALVPVIDSIERKVINGKNSTSYSYDMYVHFDIYITRSKEKLCTLKINNKRNILGMMALGQFQYDNSDLSGLSDDEVKDEKSFRSAVSGLWTVLKKKLRELPQFRIKTELSQINHSTFGFEMGRDMSIKIDHRYKTYVSKANGKQKITGFGKIRKVEECYSEAQILIGKPSEGDQVIEDPKLGINFVGGFGTVPLHIAYGYRDVVTGSHSCIFVGAEYDVGSFIKSSEWYLGANLRIGLPGPVETLGSISITQVLFDLGVLKKFYFRRFALNLGAYIGVHSARVTEYSSTRDASSVGLSLKTALEIMITPTISAYGGLNLDMYGNPSNIKVDDLEYDFDDTWEWNAKGLSLNFGVKVTF